MPGNFEIDLSYHTSFIASFCTALRNKRVWFFAACGTGENFSNVLDYFLGNNPNNNNNNNTKFSRINSNLTCKCIAVI